MQQDEEAEGEGDKEHGKEGKDGEEGQQDLYRDQYEVFVNLGFNVRFKEGKQCFKYVTKKLHFSTAYD